MEREQKWKRERASTDNIARTDATGRAAPEVPDVLLLQQIAGNRAVGDLIATMQRLGLEDAKDLWHHLVGDDRENDKDPAEESEEVALHAKQVMEVGAAAFNHVAEQAKLQGNGEQLAKARELAEHFQRGGELIETGERIFIKGAKVAKVIRQLDEMSAACKDVRDADLTEPGEQRKGARALDTLFGSAGELAGELVPDGPWKGYFSFLQGFKQYDFFGHWADFIHHYTGHLGEASTAP